MAGTESTNMANGSSTSASTVVVTARDIEFSNYDSSTGKWGNAVMTMMIEDANTPDNINLEVYDERVYAVFRNHYDHTDTVRTSAEVDGMDFRVTISTPMVASGKYELYKVYGETSGREYATTSQFYFQVPGKVWDFANDTVEEDVELVSDWWNYGEVITSDNVVHGFPSRDDAVNAAAGNAGATITVNGETLNTDDIISYKLTSAFTGQVPKLSNKSGARFVSGYNSLQNLDIVSSGLTGLQNYSTYTLWSTSYNQKFGFPSTITAFDGWFRNLNNVYNKPIYMPDSVTRIYGFMGMNSNSSNFTSKIRFSPNITYRGSYNLYYMQNWAGSISNMSTNVQLPDAQNAHVYVFGFGSNFYKGVKNGTWISPPAWTYIPSYWGFCYYGRPNIYSSYPENIKIVLSEGITSVHEYSLINYPITEIDLPSTLVEMPTFSGTGGTTVANYLKLDMSKCTLITALPNNFLNSATINMSEFKFPPNLITIGSNFLAISVGQGGATASWPVDGDNKKYFVIPEGVTTLGNNCLGSVITSRVRVELPSTLTSVGGQFCYTYAISSYSNMPWEIDLSQFTPDIFAESTGSFACYAVSNYQAFWKIKVAPGTSDAWAERFPNISREDNGHTYWTRHIEWVETPTPYGYVFYKDTVNSTETKYLELQSMNDYNQFAGKSTNAQITVDDGEGGQITFSVGTTANKIVTGFYNGTDITSIPQQFLANFAYLKKFKFGGNETSIGANFCNGAGSSLQSSDTMDLDIDNIPALVTAIGSGFCYGTKVVSNGTVTVPSGITTLVSFLSDCSKFNSPVVFPTTLSSSSSLLSGCTSFNQSVTLPSTMNNPKYFMNRCSAFNQPLDWSNTTVTGQITGFMNYCSSFNQPIDLSGFSGVSYWENFLYDCSAFNQPVTFPAFSQSTNLSWSFYRCTSFNSAITFTSKSNISSFGSCLMYCTSFNQPLDLSGIRSTGYTLRGCTSFNSTVVIDSNADFGGFMEGCTSFNQPFTLGENSQSSGVYGNICKNWKSFNQPITIPASWCKANWYNSASIFEGCDSLTSTVTILGTTAPTTATAVAKSFSTTDSTAATYTTGVTFAGAGASAWKTALPDSTTSPYRKINVV